MTTQCLRSVKFPELGLCKSWISDLLGPWSMSDNNCKKHQSIRSFGGSKICRSGSLGRVMTLNPALCIHQCSLNVCKYAHGTHLDWRTAYLPTVVCWRNSESLWSVPGEMAIPVDQAASGEPALDDSPKMCDARCRPGRPFVTPPPACTVYILLALWVYMDVRTAARPPAVPSL